MSIPHLQETEAYWLSTAPSLRHETDLEKHRLEIRSRLPDAVSGMGLDYGCGGGAGLDAMLSAGCSDVLGVDVSLATAGRGVHRVIHPSQLDELTAASFGFVLSSSVFQHLYDAEQAEWVLGHLSRLAAPGAQALIQTRYFEPGDGFDPSRQRDDYRGRAIRSHAWQVPSFWSALERHGFTPLVVELEPGRQYAWYTAQRRP